MRKRTQARELALQILYQLDLRGDEILDEVSAALAPGTGDSEMVDFARELVFGFREKREIIDRQIEEVAKNWQLKRMAAIDRNILRLATYELLYREDIPPLVTINEAIDIAKKFSTKNSGPFVNGILDNIRLRAAPPGKQNK
ncbi:MAG TPA: transcription antitermination factor NusB [Planctomycetota bacterium]|nr:transcription antitermination factor NusB [Planctomycetota bacterium]